MFLNNSLKQMLRHIGYNEIGKSKKFFNSKSMLKIPNTELILFGGY
jgi:hypothetical protein